MALSVFKTVRGRLLALLVAITLPIACLSAAAAISTYKTVQSAIQTAQIRVAEDFAIRTRVWYRGALRSLLATAATMQAMPAPQSDCGRVAGEVLKGVPGYVALRIAIPGRPACVVSLADAVSAADLQRIEAALNANPPVPALGGNEPTEARYGQVAIGDQRYLVISARDRTGGGNRDALLLAKPDLLNTVFDLGTTDLSKFVALISRGGDVVLSRGGKGHAENGWLPKAEFVPDKTERWDAPSRAGPNRAYSARIVAAPDLYVVASFDDGAERAAQTQFLALLTAPLMTLALLCIFYMRAIDQHCVRWLRSIEGVARSRAASPKARVSVSEDMPREIRSAADAFNAMADEEEVRQRRLQLAIEDNRYLVRELHHRVKNSLQVVQSYLGLTKRDHQGPARLALSDAECRVHVLSAAYRFTLADGEMQPVRIDIFLEDVVSVLSSLIRRGEQSVSSQVETVASLPIDRIIPLGFLIVDVASRALRAATGIAVTIVVKDIDGTTIEVSLETDRPITTLAAPRIFAGLLAQVEAVEIGPAEGHSLGVWRLRHGD